MSSEFGDNAVAFVINAFERNILRVTEAGFLTRAIAQHGHGFATRTLLINNVSDREDAQCRAQAAVDRGEIDEFIFVDERIEAALEVVGIAERDFGRYLHWSDCCIVALTLDGPDLLCYVDVDMALRGSGDWIGQALEVFAADSRVGVANPIWRMPDGYTSAYAEADERGPNWLKGYGFTDQVFLCRRSVFTLPLIARGVPLFVSCPASLRYPGQQLLFGTSTLFFEQIIDAFMRSRGILRLTLTSREFEPVPTSTYAAIGWQERISRRLTKEWLEALSALGHHFPRWLETPRVRTSGLLDSGYGRRVQSSSHAYQ